MPCLRGQCNSAQVWHIKDGKVTESWLHPGDAYASDEFLVVGAAAFSPTIVKPRGGEGYSVRTGVSLAQRSG